MPGAKKTRTPTNQSDSAVFPWRSVTLPVHNNIEGNRKNWLKKMKLDVKHLLHKRPANAASAMARRVKVDFRLTAKRKAISTDVEDEDSAFLNSENNLSRNLVLGSLQDGVFCAELPLTNIPKGDLTIQVNDYKLTLIITRRSVNSMVDKKHILIKPFAVGFVEMPIYVVPLSLRFQLQWNNDDNLLIRGMMKGTLDRNGKASLSPKSAAIVRYRERTYSFDGPSQGAGDIEEMAETFRDRCNTR